MKIALKNRFLSTTDKKDSNLSLLFISQAINVIGDDFFNIAVMWIVYAESRSTFLTAIIGVLWHLTDVIVNPIAGVYADTKNKRKILIFTNGLAAIVCFFVLIYVCLFKGFPVWLAISSVILLNALTTFTSPTRAALLPQLVQPDELISVNGKFSTVIQISSMVGSSLSGIVLSILGITGAIFLNSLSFIIVVFCFYQFNWNRLDIPSEDEPLKPNYPFIDNFSKGVQYLKSQPRLIRLVVFLLLFNSTSFLGSLYPALIFEKLGDNPEAYGIIQTVALIGGIFGGLLITKKPQLFKNQRITILICLIIVSISLIGLTYSTYFLSSMLCTFVEYAATTIASISITTLIMSHTNANYMGRVQGLVRSISIILIPVTTLLAGYLGTKIDVTILFYIGAFLTACVAIGAVLLLDKTYPTNVDEITPTI